MNHLDHFLRREVLSGSPPATVVLTVGTEEVLYPIANVYNARPGVPFRTADTSFTIDIDFKAARTFTDVHLLGTNLENISGVAIDLSANNTFPPPGSGIFASTWGADDNISDFIGFVSLYSYRWDVGGSFRYWRIIIAVPNMKSPFAQIGEIYFNNTGDYSWWDEPDKLRTSYNWPLRSDPVLQHERESRTRMMRLSASTEFRNATKAQLASELESKYRTQELAKVFPFDESADAPLFFGQSTALGIRQVFTDKWDGNDSGDSILQTFDGDGKI